MTKRSYKLITALVVGISVAGGLWVVLENIEGYETKVVSLDSEMTREQVGWDLIRAGALVVDVRTPDEFASGHIEGAILVPHDQVSNQLVAFGDDKSRDIVVYCGSGKRAELVETVLAEAGFVNVHNAGGYQPLMSSKPQDDDS